MIKKFNFLQLRNAEYLTLNEDILAIANAPGLLLDKQAAALQVQLTKMGGLMRINPSSKLTDELAGLDALRDRCITGLVKMCDALSYHPDADTRAAADTLSHSLDFYGAGIAAQTYNAETTTITNILTDWRTKAELIAAVAKLGLEDWLTAMEAANNRFKKTYQDRTDELAAGTSPDTTKAARVDTNLAYEKLRGRLESYYEMNDGAEPWAAAVAKINTLLGQYGATLDSRAGRSAAARKNKSNAGDSSAASGQA